MQQAERTPSVDKAPEQIYRQQRNRLVNREAYIKRLRRGIAQDKHENGRLEPGEKPIGYGAVCRLEADFCRAELKRLSQPSTPPAAPNTTVCVRGPRRRGAGRPRASAHGQAPAAATAATTQTQTDLGRACVTAGAARPST